jgi:hypothetical protein
MMGKLRLLVQCLLKIPNRLGEKCSIITLSLNFEEDESI